MQILELVLQHFGKFEHQRISLHRGINIIYGGNETGKSTIAAFIRAMFFGIEHKGTRGGRPDEYALRQPWENGAWFAGILRLSYGGKIYRIERNFYRNDRSVRLICETDGQEAENAQEAIGQILGGMSENAFSQTIWMTQEEIRTDRQLSGHLEEAMVRMQEGGDDHVDVRMALQSLERRRKEVQKEKLRQREALDEQIAVKRLEYARLKEEMDRLDGQLYGQPNSKEERGTERGNDGAAEPAGGSSPEREGGNDPAKEKRLRPWRGLNSAGEKGPGREDAAGKKPALGLAGIPYPNTVCALSLIVCLLALICTWLVKPLFLKVLTLVTAILSDLLSGAILITQAVRGKTDGENGGIRRFLAEAWAGIRRNGKAEAGTGDAAEAGKTAGPGNAAKTGETAETGKAAKTREKAGTGDAAEAEKAAETGNTAKSGETAETGKAAKVREKAGTGDTAEAEKAAETGNAAKAGETAETGKAAHAGREAQKRQAAAHGELLRQLTERRQTLDMQRKNLKQELQQLYQENDRMASFDTETEALEMAGTRIREISDNWFRISVRDMLERTGELLAEMTGGKYTAVSLDEKGQLMISTPEHLLRPEQVSRGAMNQLYFAFRITAGELLGGADLPLILDDVFCTYDDERLASALAFLEKAGRQVILLTCQTREKDLLEAHRS